MAYEASEQYDLPVSDTNTVRIPAVEQRLESVRYDDEVRVELEVDTGVIESVSFTAFVTSANSITIPRSVRRRFDVGDTATVSFEATGEVWSPQERPTARTSVYESANPEETEMKAVTEIVEAEE